MLQTLNWQSAKHFMYNVKDLAMEKENFKVISFVWWCCWFQRNKIIFDPSSIPRHIVVFIVMHYHEWEATHKVSNTNKDNGNQALAATNKMKKWKKPRSGFVKLNFEG